MAHVGLRKRAVLAYGTRASKWFPKAFSAVTTNAEDGYPVYSRRDNGRVVNVGGVQVDNRWVVPYNPYLLLKFNAHVAVQSHFWCNRVYTSILVQSRLHRCNRDLYL